MSVEHQIIDILSDGCFHSGEKLAEKLSISRTTVWKILKEIQATYGIDVHAVTGKGYRFSKGLDLLNVKEIDELLRKQTVKQSIIVETFYLLDSTNQYLLNLKRSNEDACYVCLSEMQNKGRGRRGRQWVSAFAKNINLSLVYQIQLPMFKIAGLSIAVGVAVAETLKEMGVDHVGLKWPNDVHVDEKKIAGILIELKGEADGPVKTVVGLGLNVDLPAGLKKEIDQPVTDIFSHLVDQRFSRNKIAGHLIMNICQAVHDFTQTGLQTFIQRWELFDVYLGKNVYIGSDQQKKEGIYRGINESGELVLENKGQLILCNSGEVSMRPVI